MNIYMILSFTPFVAFLVTIFVYQLNIIRVDRVNPAIDEVMSFNERKVTRSLLAQFINYAIGFFLLYLHVNSLEDFQTLSIIAYVIGILTLISGIVKEVITGIKAFCYIIGYCIWCNEDKLRNTIKIELDKVHEAFDIPKSDEHTQRHEIHEATKLIITHEVMTMFIHFLFSILSVTVLLKLVIR